MLFQVTRNVRGFSTLATSLSEILDYSSACLNHGLIVQRQSFWYAADSYSIYAQFIDGSRHVVSKSVTAIASDVGESVRFIKIFPQDDRDIAASSAAVTSTTES